MILISYLAAIFGTPIVSGLISIPLMLATIPILAKNQALKFPIALAESTCGNILAFGLFIWLVKSVLSVSLTVWMFVFATFAFAINNIRRLLTRSDMELETGHFAGDMAGIWIAWFLWG